MTAPNTLLRAALLADAATCAAMGALLAALAASLAAPFGLPEGLLRAVGLVLLPWAGWLAWLARGVPARGAVRVVIALNLLWVLDSLLLLAAAPWLGLAPTALGGGFVLAQAVAALGVTAVQAFALHRSAAAAAA